jgi:hypothetical protein
MSRRFKRFEAARAANCGCSLRSFWEGPCDWCKANPPPPEKPLTWADMVRSARIENERLIDEIVNQCAAELGFAAGQQVAKIVEYADVVHLEGEEAKAVLCVPGGPLEKLLDDREPFEGL